MEILIPAFDFVDQNSSQNCLVVARPLFSNKVKPSPFGVFEFFQPLLDEIPAVDVGFGFQH